MIVQAIVDIASTSLCSTTDMRALMIKPMPHAIVPVLMCLLGLLCHAPIVPWKHAGWSLLAHLAHRSGTPPPTPTKDTNVPHPTLALMFRLSLLCAWAQHCRMGSPAGFSAAARPDGRCLMGADCVWERGGMLHPGTWAHHVHNVHHMRAGRQASCAHPTPHPPGAQTPKHPCSLSLVSRAA